jgi:hypothetical protein
VSDLLRLHKDDARVLLVRADEIVAISVERSADEQRPDTVLIMLRGGEWIVLGPTPVGALCEKVFGAGLIHTVEIGGNESARKYEAQIRERYVGELKPAVPPSMPLGGGS